MIVELGRPFGCAVSDGFANNIKASYLMKHRYTEWSLFKSQIYDAIVGS
jgi:hypothetical protein